MINNTLKTSYNIEYFKLILYFAPYDNNIHKAIKQYEYDGYDKFDKDAFDKTRKKNTSLLLLYYRVNKIGDKITIMNSYRS